MSYQDLKVRMLVNNKFKYDCGVNIEYKILQSFLQIRTKI